jgi:menaquinone-dependent protoporphyrinogen oxidase
MTRREFVRIAATGTALLAVGSVTGCATAEDTKADDVETPSKTFGGNEMSKKILVGYATRTGSTIGVAEAIGRSLSERGFLVEVKPLREHPKVEGYDAVVLGSAINGAAWLPEAVSFLRSNASAVSGVPFAAFCVHSMNGGDNDKQTKKRLAYLDRVREVVRPTDEGFFLGKGPDPEDTSLIARWAFKAFGGSGEGDMRDWDKIGAWAGQVQV